MLSSHSDFKFEDDPSILYASKIVIAEACQCHRVVVRKISNKEYVTHMENVQLDGNTWKHRDFYWGHYFSTVSDDPELQRAERDKALADYNERCAQL